MAPKGWKYGRPKPVVNEPKKLYEESLLKQVEHAEAVAGTTEFDDIPTPIPWSQLSARERVHWMEIFNNSQKNQVGAPK